MFSLSGVGAALGFVAGAAVVAIEQLRFGVPIEWDFVLSVGSVGAILGVATGLGFGLLLMATSARLRLDEVSILRGALLGAGAGAALPLALGVALVGTLPPIAIAGTLLLMGAGFGAGLGAGLIGIAKRAHAREELEVASVPLQLE